VRIFLDTSVLIAAAGSARGASRFVVTEASVHDWELFSCDHCAEETRRNLPKLPRVVVAWDRVIAPRVRWVETRLSLDQPLVFPKAKDRPVLITALAARADWLLTLDEEDFHARLGRSVYGLRLASPGEFLLDRRAQGLI
jgi:predicted nucleic acid-binding protein